ncbi:MAG: hypothetical protein A2Y38_02160 [Spirochaetes bacterium GWB1_59_5]|nr:MAG: hypothetical protein A2Y38_02160 [Spirochaetes bacterium GWB1_59_5]
MSLKPNQRTTTLGTTRSFVILRPEGFPAGKRGLVFLTSFDDGFGGERRMVVRTDAPSGKWRIDRHTCGKLWESVPGFEGLYKTAEAAARHLATLR